MTLPTYDRAFFDSHAAGTAASADRIVPLLVDWFRPASVLDVGCAQGAWLKAFADRGVADYFGLDGDYVDRAGLLIPADRFRAADLSDPPALGRRFDLVTCLEVAEHLPEAAADRFVRFLTAHAEVVAFSAAVPGQGGTYHVNERWPSYWRDRFAAVGYEVFDPVRPRVWADPAVEVWYRQNLFVYATPAAAARFHEVLTAAPGWPLDLVHPDLFALRLKHLDPDSYLTVRSLARHLPGVVTRAARRALGR
jgi:SAM-dependent methyltransferase